MTTLTDRRINESSALAQSRKDPGIIWTCNDEPGLIFAIDPLNGKTVGTFKPSRTLKDTEALACDSEGRLWIGSIGDNNASRHDIGVAVLADPGRGNHGTLPIHWFQLTYPDGPRNAETLLIDPHTDRAFIISKESHGRLYALPSGLTSGHPGRLSDTGRTMPAYVTDATFTHSGQYVLIRTKGAKTKVYVYNATTWRQVASIRVPQVAKGESITIAPSGTGFYIGSEGTNSPLIRVALPSAYR